MSLTVFTAHKVSFKSFDTITCCLRSHQTVTRLTVHMYIPYKINQIMYTYASWVMAQIPAHMKVALCKGMQNRTIISVGTMCSHYRPYYMGGKQENYLVGPQFYCNI